MAEKKEEMISDVKAQEYYWLFDRDGDDKFDVREMAELIRNLDNWVGEEDIQRMIENVDEINKPGLNFTDFMEALTDNKYQQISRIDLINIFKFYDTEGTGRLFPETVTAILNKHPDGMPDEEVMSVIAPLTEKGTGMINYIHLVHKLIPNQFRLYFNMDIQSILHLKEHSQDPTDYPKTIGVYRLPISFLNDENKFSETMPQVVRQLEQNGFSHWRKARGDGNCYYRSIGIGFVEIFIRNQILDHLVQNLSSQISPFTIQYEGQGRVWLNLKQIFEQILEVAQDWSHAMALFNISIQNAIFDKDLVMFVRYIAAGFLKQNLSHPEIAPYIDDDWKILEEQILKEGEDAQGLTFKLVASALRIQIAHYTDFNGTISKDVFSPISTNNYEFEVSLFLKPGHYDIINKQQEIEADQYDFLTGKFGQHSFAYPPVSAAARPTLQETWVTVGKICAPQIISHHGKNIHAALSKLNFEIYRVSTNTELEYLVLCDDGSAENGKAVQIKPQYVYIGNMNSKVIQDEGIMYTKEYQYEGGWNQNLKHGQGYLKNEMMQITGTWNRDNLVEAKQISYSNQDRYSGGISLDQFNGEGTFYQSASQQTITGTWVHGDISYGKIEFGGPSEPKIYDGYIQNFMPNGQGKLQVPYEIQNVEKFLLANFIQGQPDQQSSVILQHKDWQIKYSITTKNPHPAVYTYNDNRKPPRPGFYDERTETFRKHVPQSSNFNQMDAKEIELAVKQL